MEPKESVFSPLLLINFKAYDTSTGRNAERLAEQILMAKIESKTNACVAIAVQAMDIGRVTKYGLPVFAQHVDPVSYGAHTGHVLPEGVKEAGAVGTLLNHSENQIPLTRIEATLTKTRALGLKTVACANTPATAASIAAYNPDYIAIEPPELIGGDISVSKAKPEIITDTISKVHKINLRVPVLCGAGVKNAEDVRIASKLGSKGILVASGITKAKNPKEATMDLLSGFK